MLPAWLWKTVALRPVVPQRQASAYMRLGTVALSLLGAVVVPSGYAQEVSVAKVDTSVTGPDQIIDDLSLSSRVLGGENSEVGEWPSMVAIVIPGNFPLEDRFFCGGTVIAEQWVMTAAHCMFDAFGTATQPSDIRVVAGTNNLQDDNAIETTVSNIYVHPQYDSGSGALSNDIALLELGTVLNDAPITLFDGDTESLNDTFGFIAGWGATGVDANNNVQYPYLLQDATVPFVPLERCNLPESYQGLISETQVCAGYEQGGIDSCVGDSGGPLFMIEEGRQVQVGITSFGNGCGLANFYGVYTNVSEYRVWMSNYIDLSEASTETSSESDNTDTTSGTNEPLTTGGSESGAIDGTSSESVTVGGSSSSGAMNPMLLSLLAGFGFAARAVRSAGNRRQSALLIAGSLVALSGCSSYLPADGATDEIASLSTSRDNSATVNEKGEQSMTTRILNLASMEGRPGIEELLLGASRADAQMHLTAAGFDTPTCRAEKTALQGTGRLFLREYCEVLPSAQSTLEGLTIDKLSLQFIDSQLVRIDTHLGSGAVMALSDQLNAQYEHMPSATRPFEWRLNANHIRLVSDNVAQGDDVSGVLVQMIDGRLLNKLPSLFAYL